MLDFSHLADGTPNVNIQKFYGNYGAGTTSITTWQTWRKPRGAKFVYIICVGAGASGGTGTYTTAASAGAAGGASGSQTTALWPAFFIPDILYIQPGLGGRAPAVLTSGAGSVTGTLTWVAAEPIVQTTSNTNVLIASANQANGSTAPPAVGISGNPFYGRAVFYVSIAGQAGGIAGVSGTNTGGEIIVPTNGLMVTGGAGSGGKSGTGLGCGGGGPITGTTAFDGSGNGTFPTIPSVVGATSVADAKSGTNGFIVKPFMHYGGAGGAAGGANASGVGDFGGAGGNGAPGCGGGASGPGSTGSGRPGNGGDGFVYIISW